MILKCKANKINNDIGLFKEKIEVDDYSEYLTVGKRYQVELSTSGSSERGVTTQNILIAGNKEILQLTDNKERIIRFLNTLFEPIKLD